MRHTKIKFIPLIILAILANALTIWQYNQHLAGGKGGDAAFKFILFTMPAIWLVTIIVAAIISRRNKKELLVKQLARYTWLLLLFCTPIPLFIIYFLANPVPSERNNGEERITINGKVYKTEFWVTKSGRKIVDKHFVADSAAYATGQQAAFVKDSLWIYFKENGDTEKVEVYKNDVLIKTTNNY